jgi:hypothetical protein
LVGVGYSIIKVQAVEPLGAEKTDYAEKGRDGSITGLIVSEQFSTIPIQLALFRTPEAVFAAETWGKRGLKNCFRIVI